MRRSLTALAALAVLGLSTPAPALAADPVAAAESAFRGGEHVYVDPSAEEAGKLDAAQVRSKIAADGVSVYVAVLPASAAGGGTPEALLTRMDHDLNGRETLALVVGNHVRAASSVLGTGQAGALATQAFDRSSLTNTLTSFVDKVD